MLWRRRLKDELRTEKWNQSVNKSLADVINKLTEISQYNNQPEKAQQYRR